MPTTREKEFVFDVLIQVAAAVEQLLAPHCEVVLHDLSDFEQSIIHISGDVSGREVGGGATDLLIRQARSGSDCYNYRTRSASGKQFKASTVFLREPDGTAYGAFCVNLDVSAFEAAHDVLESFLLTQTNTTVSETLSSDIQQTVQTILQETLGEMDHSSPIMTRDSKIELIARLEEKGVFQVKKAVTILADELGLSRTTVYNYLNEVRERQGKQPGKQRIEE